ncbi:hypothetical protein ZWY2020_001035 [Hordeum vulgare]|nr:hypothetical protein ZWY2020_001035 [Hordeum vulgare]
MVSRSCTISRSKEKILDIRKALAYEQHDLVLCLGLGLVHHIILPMTVKKQGQTGWKQKKVKRTSDAISLWDQIGAMAKIKEAMLAKHWYAKVAMAEKKEKHREEKWEKRRRDDHRGGLVHGDESRGHGCNGREFWEMKRMEIMLRKKMELQNLMASCGVGSGEGFSFGNGGGGLGMGGGSGFDIGGGGASFGISGGGGWFGLVVVIAALALVVLACVVVLRQAM